MDISKGNQIPMARFEDQYGRELWFLNIQVDPAGSL